MRRTWLTVVLCHCRSVSNLAPSVTKEDITELFETVGDLQEAQWM